MGVKYAQHEDGATRVVMMPGPHKVACCDCGLVHRYRYRAKRGDLYITVWRDERATSAIRRQNPDLPAKVRRRAKR